MEDAKVLRWMAIERIQAALKQQPRYDRRWSHSRLAEDYLQRIRRWADALSLEAWPFPDVAAKLFPERFAEEWRIEELGWLSRPFEACFAGYVHFCEVENTTEIQRYGMANPYEPIIRLRERGGVLTVYNGLIDTCMVAIPYNHEVVRPDWQPLATDDATLDTIDEEERRRHDE